MTWPRSSASDFPVGVVVSDELVLDHVADARAAHVHQRRRRFDRYRFLEIPNAEHRVDRGCAAHLQHDAGLDIGAETLQ